MLSSVVTLQPHSLTPLPGGLRLGHASPMLFSVRPAAISIGLSARYFILCFHIHTSSFCRNPFSFTFMQIAGCRAPAVPVPQVTRFQRNTETPPNFCARESSKSCNITGFAPELATGYTRRSARLKAAGSVLATVLLAPLEGGRPGSRQGEPRAKEVRPRSPLGRMARAHRAGFRPGCSETCAARIQQGQHAH